MGSMQWERQPSMQREDEADHGNGPGTNSSESAVNHLSKSVVRENRTPRSVGTGGGQLPPVTRSGLWQRSPATRHVLRNLGDAVGNALNRHHRDIRAAAKAATALGSLDSTPAEPVSPPVSIVLPKPLTTRQQHSLDKQAARQARFDEVVTLDAKGWSKSRIARTLGLDRGTVHVWLKTGRLPSWQQPSGDSTVEVHGDYLRQRWD